MGNCKNCGNVIEEHREYCSYSCRNIYVNLHIRDYRKEKEDRLARKVAKYDEKPKVCKKCGKTIPYRKQKNKYCNNSCAASESNQLRVGIKHKISEEGLKGLRAGHIALLKRKVPTVEEDLENYNRNPTLCIECSKPLEYRFRKKKFCNRECRNFSFRKNRSGKQQYRLDCNFKFNIWDYPDSFNLKLIEEHGYYKAKNRGDNPNGVDRDHMYSIEAGYKQNISPELISHPANCELLLHSDNIRKRGKCSITLEDLLERIEKWKNMYST